MTTESEDYFIIGVDVGTASVRAGLFDSRGALVHSATRPLEIWNPKPEYYEQSSDQVWESCCSCVKEISGNVDRSRIVGIGFDATCSLVAVGRDDGPITVSLSGADNQNIIMWMDHRASKEADTINSTKHSVLQFVGGVVSIEMQLPKLLWLKRNLPESYAAAKYFFDLPDFLTWKATGSTVRSQCSTVCKWNYLVDHEGPKGWQDDFLQQIGLEDLVGENRSRIGTEIKCPGTAQGEGLTEAAAARMGLNPGTAVGVSLIDAYAGTLGTLGCRIEPEWPLSQRLVSICGTSTCHMAVTNDPVFVPGVWGPYSGVLLGNHWVLEAGQSATGKLLDHVVDTHPASGQVKQKFPDSVQEGLVKILESMARTRNLENTAELTRDLHVWPDFHGNRSPLADPNLKGMVCGLTLDVSEENLAKTYLATIQALCYGTRHILESLKSRNVETKCILVCGGLSKNELFVSTMSSVLGLPVVVPGQSEPVLLGAAMLAACAAAKFSTLEEAMKALGGKGSTIMPNSDEAEYHERKYQVFLKMLEHQRCYDSIMDSIQPRD